MKPGLKQKTVYPNDLSTFIILLCTVKYIAVNIVSFLSMYCIFNTLHYKFMLHVFYKNKV